VLVLLCGQKRIPPLQKMRIWGAEKKKIMKAFSSLHLEILASFLYLFSSISQEGPSWVIT
jgi:hypothetical protein